MESEYFDFLKDAYTSGLCDEYRSEIRKCGGDKHQLIRLAMRQQSIPYIATKMREGVITKQYLLNAYSGFLNGFILNDCDDVSGYTYAWYVDYDYDNDLLVETDVAHISYTVGASVVVPNTKCPILYISNRSNVHLVLEGYNSVKIYLFDESKATIEDMGDESEIIVYKYSDKCVVNKGRYCFGRVSEFNKKLKL